MRRRISDYQGVLTTLGKTGDDKDNVLKVNIPRNDLRVTIRQRPAATPFGFGGWVARPCAPLSTSWQSQPHAEELP
jgi:hypothetical protein